MYNIGDDKELDRLSREAAGRYTPPGEANWQALSEELDRIMPVTEKKKRRFLFWWLLPLLLIGGGAAYWIGTHPSTTEAIHTTTASPSGSTSSEAIQESSPAISSKTPVETDQELLRKEPQPQKPGAAQNESTKPVNTQTETVSGLPKNKTLRTGKPNSRPDKMRNDRSSGIKELADNSPTIPASGNSTAVDKKADITLQLTQPVTEKTATPTTDQPQKKGAEQSQNNIAEKTATPATITESTKTPETTPAPVANTNNSSGKGFSYAFVAGVDKSTVKFVYGNDPGMNLGMMAGYHFSNRWSVHTGLIYTQKNYKVAGKDFTAPKGNWVSYYNLESITGYCRMWEVPLQVRYTMGKKKKKKKKKKYLCVDT
eukprot:Opistho-1_new@101520